jgi:hypothetical protein
MAKAATRKTQKSKKGVTLKDLPTAKRRSGGAGTVKGGRRRRPNCITF